MTAPDVDTDTGALRERVLRALVQSDYDSPVEDLRPILEHECTPEYERYADALLALPALRDLIAERDQAVAAVKRVEELLDPANRMAYQLWGGRLFSEKSVRRALDGDQ